MITARRNQAESNLKDYGKEYPVVEADRPPWVLLSVMQGVILADRITAWPDVGKFLLSNFRDEAVGGQVLWLESEAESRLEPGLESRLKSEPESESKSECEPESKPESKSKSKPSGDLGDSGTPLVSHWGQTGGSLLPCRQKLQEEIEMLEAVPITNCIHHSDGQVGEDDFQRVTGGYDIE